MNLRKLAGIFKRNIKSNEKSSISRIDIFLIIALFILIAAPVVISIVNRINAEIQLVNLFVSPRFEELFGSEMTESLMEEFNEANPGIRVRLYFDQEDREPDIFVFDDNDKIDAEESVTLVSFMDVLFYNIDVLSEAGFDRPPRTRGEYQTYSRTSAAMGFYSDDIFTPENNRPESRKLEDFAQGRAAMIITSTRAIPHFRERMGDERFSITAVPSDDRTTGRYDINLTGIYTGINPNSIYKEEAQIFVDFLAEYHTVFCEMFKAVPGTESDLIPGDYVKDDPFYSKAWDIFEYNRTESLQH